MSHIRLFLIAALAVASACANDQWTLGPEWKAGKTNNPTVNL